MVIASGATRTGPHFQPNKCTRPGSRVQVTEINFLEQFKTTNLSVDKFRLGVDLHVDGHLREPTFVEDEITPKY